MQHVFIVGCARTGSKLHMGILNMSPRVNIMKELIFLYPLWAKQDFIYKAKKIGSLKNDGNIPKLIELMYSGTLEGGFWRIYKQDDLKVIQNSITDLDPKRLEKRILVSDRTYKSIFRTVIEEHAILQNKDIAGAKFPVNISCVPKLIEWFPDSKIIHLVRNPLAIYPSMVSMDMASSNVKAKKSLIQIRRFLYTCHQYKKTVEVHKKYKNMANYHLSKFEDIVSDSDTYVRKLCDFLEIEFMAEMLNPSVTGTRYKTKRDKKTGFDEKTLSRWKERISPLARKLMNRILWKEMKEMGYL